MRSARGDGLREPPIGLAGVPARMRGLRYLLGTLALPALQSSRGRALALRRKLGETVPYDLHRGLFAARLAWVFQGRGWEARSKGAHVVVEMKFSTLILARNGERFALMTRVKVPEDASRAAVQVLCEYFARNGSPAVPHLRNGVVEICVDVEYMDVCDLEADSDRLAFAVRRELVDREHRATTAFIELVVTGSNAPREASSLNPQPSVDFDSDPDPYGYNPAATR